MIIVDLDKLEQHIPPLHYNMVSNELFGKGQAKYARVAISVLGPGGGAEMHRHPGSEHYFLMLEGRLRVRTDKGEVVVGPGQAVLIEDGEPHQVINDYEGTTRYFAIAAPYPAVWDPVAQSGKR